MFVKYFIQILQAETESQLQDAVAQASSLISLAGHNVRITLQNKQETALDLTHWYVLQRTRAPFERYDRNYVTNDFNDGCRDLKKKKVELHLNNTFQFVSILTGSEMA